MQVYFNGTQTVLGLNATEFSSNPIAVSAWKATVSSACNKNMSEYIRVDILSVEDAGDRRRLTLRDQEARQLQVKLAVKIGFKVSYTLQDFNTDNVNITTRVLKANYQQSITNQTFVKEFAIEVKKRTSQSQALIDKFQPVEVLFASSYVMIETTEHPTFKPTFSPSSGTCYIDHLILLKFIDPNIFGSVFCSCPNLILEGFCYRQYHLELHLREYFP